MTKRGFRGAALVALSGGVGLVIGAALADAPPVWPWPSAAQIETDAVLDRRDLAERLYALAVETDALDAALTASEPLLIAQLDLYAEREGLALSDEARERVAAIVQEEATAVLARRRAEIVEIYAEELSVDALTWAIALYESPEGRAFLESSPRISARISSLIGDDLGGVAARLAARIEDEVAPLLPPR